MRPQLRFTIQSLLCCLLAAFAKGDVIVVGANATHTTIQSAVDAAVDGDIIRVEPGQYFGFSASGKALTVLALDPGNRPAITTGVYLSDTTADQAVLLSGLIVTFELLWNGPPALDIRNCAGPVRLHDIHVPAELIDSVNHDPPALDVRDCANVSISQSHFEGFTGPPGSPTHGYPGGDAIRINASKVALSDCYIKGGDGGEVNDCCGWIGGRGGHGIKVNDISEVFLGGCTPGGGQGGLDFWDTTNAPDGQGVFSIGAAAIVRSRGGGAFTSGGTPPILYAGQQPTLQTRPYLVEGSTLALLIKGTPGARVGLYFGTDLAYDDQVIFEGPQLVATPAAPLAGAWRFLGTMPPNGEWTGTFTTPDLPTLTHATFHLMAVTAMGTDRLYSNSASTVIADSAW